MNALFLVPLVDTIHSDGAGTIREFHHSDKKRWGGKVTVVPNIRFWQQRLNNRYFRTAKEGEIAAYRRDLKAAQKAVKDYDESKEKPQLDADQKAQLSLQREMVLQAESLNIVLEEIEKAENIDKGEDA